MTVIGSLLLVFELVVLLLKVRYVWPFWYESAGMLRDLASYLPPINNSPGLYPHQGSGVLL